MMEALRRAIKRVLGRIWFAAFERVHPGRTASRVPTVLLVRSDGIGDLLFSLPLIESIRKHDSTVKTVLVCDAAAAPFVERLSIVDEVIPYHRRRYRVDPLERWRTWSVLRRMAPERAVSLTYHRSPSGDELVLAVAADQTVCMSGNDELMTNAERARFDARHTRVVAVPDHVAERTKYGLLARAEGWPSVDWDRSYAAALRDPEGVVGSQSGGDRQVVAIAPGGSSPLRHWPPTRWKDLIKRLEAPDRLTCELVGGEPDRLLIEALSAQVGPSVTCRIGGDVLEVAQTILRADLVVGIDSGISHLAARLGIPGVVVLGGGHFSRYFPYGSATTCVAPQPCYECNWHCHRDQVYCLTEISVASVEREIRRRLSAPPR